jgi:hypothetical protein
MARLSKHKRGLLLARRYGFVSKRGVVYRKVPGRGLVKVKKSRHRRRHKVSLAKLRRDLQAAIFQLNSARAAFSGARIGSRKRVREASAFYRDASAALRRYRR